MAGPENTETLGEQFRAGLLPVLDEMLQAIGTGACVVDDNGRIVAVNAAAVELLARPVEDLLGRAAHDLLHRDAHGRPVPATRCSMRQVSHAARTAQGEQEYFARGDGSLLLVSWLITPYDLGDRSPGTLVLFHTPGGEEGADPRPEPALRQLSELERLALPAETTSQLTSTLDVKEAVRSLAALVVPRLADFSRRPRRQPSRIFLQCPARTFDLR
ncbi:PAS domain-containing protein [Streptomyces sp. NPDC094038]|uniref:PAS domain-containing protein n=1 Tax=Streptomyces sp. NPDC094038 TaxID=3366055 RepID=UPI0037FB812E